MSLVLSKRLYNKPKAYIISAFGVKGGKNTLTCGVEGANDIWHATGVMCPVHYATFNDSYIEQAGTRASNPEVNFGPS